MAFCPSIPICETIVLRGSCGGTDGLALHCGAASSLEPRRPPRCRPACRHLSLPTTENAFCALQSPAKVASAVKVSAVKHDKIQRMWEVQRSCGRDALSSRFLGELREDLARSMNHLVKCRHFAKYRFYNRTGGRPHNYTPKAQSISTYQKSLHPIQYS
jgi:hypothetical protein